MLQAPLDLFYKFAVLLVTNVLERMAYLSHSNIGAVFLFTRSTVFIISIDSRSSSVWFFFLKFLSTLLHHLHH